MQKSFDLPMPQPSTQNQNMIFVPRGKCPDITFAIFAHCNRKGIIAPKNSSNASTIYISYNYSVKNSSKS